ncbi:MAG: hypothetical protein IPJ67_05375 [Candidatus Moraniibacteriota bacterium]|nr:MAG: hypothetical protein IPJ67_05375 [Candidatus Moranbacteria bacterium]
MFSIRLFSWTIIALFLAVGAGFYWKHQGQNESKAGTTVNAPETTINTLTTGLVGHWTFDALDISGTTVTDRGTGGNDGTITGAVPALGKLGQGWGLMGVGIMFAWAMSLHSNVPTHFRFRHGFISRQTRM